MPRWVFNAFPRATKYINSPTRMENRSRLALPEKQESEARPTKVRVWFNPAIRGGSYWAEVEFEGDRYMRTREIPEEFVRDIVARLSLRTKAAEKGMYAR